LAAISAREETIDPRTANGIDHAARHLKQKVREIEADLNRLNQQARRSQKYETTNELPLE
jgi:hypothetical protein